ncbi:MAG: hypothetical protein ACRDX8_03545 [Acidimicrobiales bacterium]
MNGSGPDRAILARAVASAISAVSGVARMSPGWGVQVGTQHPGGTVVGVSLLEDAVVAHIVLDRLPVIEVTDPALAAAQAALRALGDPRPVEVVVDDIVVEAFGDG